MYIYEIRVDETESERERERVWVMATRRRDGIENGTHSRTSHIIDNNQANTWIHEHCKALPQSVQSLTNEAHHKRCVCRLFSFLQHVFELSFALRAFVSSADLYIYIYITNINIWEYYAFYLILQSTWGWERNAGIQLNVYAGNCRYNSITIIQLTALLYCEWMFILSHSRIPFATSCQHRRRHFRAHLKSDFVILLDEIIISNKRICFSYGRTLPLFWISIQTIWCCHWFGYVC